MLDALRHHKAPPPDGGEAPTRAAAGHNVPAPLAQVFGRPQPDEHASTGKRLGLALVLVGVTALLLWQVAAMNDLLPAGPFSRLLRPVTAERSQAAPLPVRKPPAQAVLRPAEPPAAAPAPQPAPPAQRPPSAPSSAAPPSAPPSAPSSTPSSTASPAGPAARTLPRPAAHRHRARVRTSRSAARARGRDGPVQAGALLPAHGRLRERPHPLPRGAGG